MKLSFLLLNFEKGGENVPSPFVDLFCNEIMMQTFFTEYQV